jgi:hypothetical protein
MTLMLNLPPDLETRLQMEAGHRGVNIEEYALQLLRSGVQPRTVGEEIVAEWERAGVIGSRPDILDSQEHARALRQRAQTRDRG